jgi:DNA repair protein RecO (recombination protein O)
MIIKDEGYILSAIKYGEKALIVTILSASKGKIVGFVSDGNSKKNRGIFQIGNKIFYEASCRLEENMKRLFRIELVEPNAINIMMDFKKLELISATVPMFIKLLNENEEVLPFYEIIGKFFKANNIKEMLTQYSYFEFYALEYLGLGLMLDCCAVTGQTDDLYYVSPKTSKAVCKEIGAPYHDKLFKYPQFVVDKSDSPSYKEIFNVLEMTSYFLKENFFKFHNIKMPESRHKIKDILANIENEA